VFERTDRLARLMSASKAALLVRSEIARFPIVVVTS